MLGSLARKLRLYGYDVKYNTSFYDNLLLDIALHEGRWLVTGDRALNIAAKKRNIKCCIISREDGIGQAAILFKEINIQPPTIDPALSRCTVCNNSLVTREPKDVKGLVNEGVLKRNNVFYQCKGCGKIYWLGHHWKKIREFDKQVRKMIEQH